MNFPIDKTDAEYVDKFSDYRIFRTEGYKHVLYKNGNATVIISRPVLTPGDIIISFAYLFAFILFFSNMIILIIRRPVVKKHEYFKFQTETATLIYRNTLILFHPYRNCGGIYYNQSVQGETL